MKNLHIENSYNTWSLKSMRVEIRKALYNNYQSLDTKAVLNRNYPSLYAEWYLHNIGYHVTKPFCKNKKIKSINLRCKDVDLEEWRK